MKILKIGILYLLGIILLLLGVLVLLLEEPFYALGFILISTFTLPFTLALWNKVLPKKKWFVPVIISTISLTIIVSIFTFGRKQYYEIEPRDNTVIEKLSVHPIQSVTVNNLDYYYIEKGKGPTIILLHGFPDMANTWDQTISELSKDYRVIAPFLRGYYPTSIPKDDDYSVRTIASDIVELAEKLHVDSFIIAGQDWGASIAYSVANIATHKVKKIVSIAIPHPTALKPNFELLWAGRHFFLLGSGDYGIRYARKNNFEYIERLYQRWSPDYTAFKNSSDPIIETFKYPDRLGAALGYYRSFAKETNSGANAEFYNNLQDIPVLFMAGENDAIATPEIENLMRNTMPEGSSTKIFKDAGHFLHQEIFPEFIKDFKKFIEK